MATRVLCRLENPGLNRLTLNGEKKLKPGQHVYLEFINVIGANYPTSDLIVIQPVNCRFVFPTIDVASTTNSLIHADEAFYFPLTSANTFERWQPVLVLPNTNVVPQNLTFNVYNQAGLSGGLTFTTIYLQFLIQ